MALRLPGEGTECPGASAGLGREETFGFGETVLGWRKSRDDTLVPCLCRSIAAFLGPPPWLPVLVAIPLAPGSLFVMGTLLWSSSQAALKNLGKLVVWSHAELAAGLR